MKLHTITAVFAFVLLNISSAFSTPITINPGESAFFNFDLTGLTPGPVYDQIQIYTDITDIDGDELGTWNFYSEFGPPLSNFVGGGPLISDPLIFSAADINDGIFSLQLVIFADSGSSLTVDPYAVGVVFVPGSVNNNTDRTPPAVPLPGALGLMSIGLGMLGTMIRRRKT